MEPSFFDDMDGQIPPTTCCHSLSLGERVCVRINFPVYSLCWGVCLHTLSTFCQPSTVTLCPCVRVCVTVCVLSAQGAWPILLLFLDNGCIYILILDYLADSEEGFLSAWCMQTTITIPWSWVRKSLLYSFPHFCAANLRRLQAQNHQNGTKTNLGM